MSDILFLSITELHAKLKAKELTCVELTKRFLERAETVQKESHVFLTILPERAMAQAVQADNMFAEGRATVLTGIPYAVKDNFCIAGVRTTAASKILEHYVAPYTATAIVRLEAAGAICIGKTNLDEFAMGSSTEYSAYGPSRNPYNPNLVPGGSSGGSAVAVASGCCVFGLGSDTGGSVRQPAAFSGVVGTKTTYGRVSRYGVIALTSSLDSVSPFTRSVFDAAIVTGWLAGTDPMDCTTPDQPIEQYETHLTPETSLVGKKIGLPKEYMQAEGLHPEIKRVVEKATAQLEAAGAELVPLSMPLTTYALPAYYIINPSEASSNLARFNGVTFGLRAPGTATAQELIELSRDMGFGPDPKRRIILGTFALSSGYHEAYYGRAQKVRTLICEEFKSSFAQVDALLTPTTPTPPFAFGEVSDPLQMYLADLFTIPANLAGICGMSLPGGVTSEGLPVGIQLLAPQFAEDSLFQIAYAAEQVLKVEPPPLAV